MTDWDALQRALWAAIRAHDARVGESAAQYAALIREAIRAGGMTLTPEAEQYIREYLDAADGLIRDGIGAAVEPYASVAAAGAGMRSAWVAQQTAEAYARRWPDGLRLSDRVWKWGEQTRTGVTEALAAAVRAGRASGAATMDLQRAIEASAGQRFTLETRLVEHWASRLHQAAQGSIRDPRGRALWAEAVAKARAHVDGLKDGGTRRQAEHALQAMIQAVADGRADLLDRHLEWWLYDRQLYALRRIARTEMATAGHRAVLAASEADPLVLGYRWRLSASHPEPDICDYYANVDFGMGAGVWPKDRAPQGKAHPHCMCSLTPTTRRMRKDGQRGSEDIGALGSPLKRPS